MRKSALCIAVLAASVICSIPVCAANTTTGKTDFSLYVENGPVYTVTVPESVALSPTEHTQVPISASNVKYIPEGKKISVTLESGSGVYGRLYMQGTDEETNEEYLMTLNIKGTDGDFKSGALEKQIKGMELAAFTEDGTADYELYPASQDYPDSTNKNLVIQKGVHYSASITYGIQLKDI